MFVCGLMRASVPSWRLTTHAAPSPNASALGPLPTRIAGSTLRVRGSIRVTVPASSLATHSAPAPAVIAEGFAPTAIGRVSPPRSRSMPRMRPSTPDATHTTPSANARARGTLPTGYRCTTLSAPGSTWAHHARVAVRDPQRAAAVRERSGAATDGDPHLAVTLEMDAGDGAVGRVGDPHRSTTVRDGNRARADGDLVGDAAAIRVDQPDGVLVDPIQPFGLDHADDAERGDAEEEQDGGADQQVPGACGGGRLAAAGSASDVVGRSSAGSWARMPSCSCRRSAPGSTPISSTSEVRASR